MAVRSMWSSLAPSVGVWRNHCTVLPLLAPASNWRRAVGTATAAAAQAATAAAANATSRSVSSSHGGAGEKFLPLDLGRVRPSWSSRPKHRGAPAAGVGACQPRADAQPVDQHWPSVWPAPRTYQPASVPLPLRQGWDGKLPGEQQLPQQQQRRPTADVLGRHGNAELMKLANFLHLTPPAIREHCAALKRFCTPWPDNLRDDAALDRCLPLQVSTQDFVHALPTIGHADARVVVLQVSLHALGLSRGHCDSRVRDKFLRLTWQWHRADTDTLRLTADRCPRRRQNYRHALYQLTVCRREAQRCADWERPGCRQRRDHQHYEWRGSQAQRVCRHLVAAAATSGGATADCVAALARATRRVLDEPEPSESATRHYANTVCRLYDIAPVAASASA